MNNIEICGIVWLNKYIWKRGIKMKKYFFTSESVTEGHPDKLCDLISDSILDECLKQDENSRVAVETFASNNLITVAGEITTKAVIDVESIVRNTIKEIGYDNKDTDIDYRTCEVRINIDKQSHDIAMGVDIGGAGDQGIMFGYASSETENYMPYAINMAHKLAKRLTEARKNGEIKFIRPDGKTQVTVEYEDDKPKRIETILVSTQHLETVSAEEVRKAVIENVINCAKELSYAINDLTFSSIKGPSGNIEYLIWLSSHNENKATPDIKNIVEKVINELDWRTYASAYDKEKSNPARSNRFKDAATNAFNRQMLR